jgi:hypothetical protein
VIFGFSAGVLEQTAAIAGDLRESMMAIGSELRLLIVLAYFAGFWDSGCVCMAHLMAIVVPILHKTVNNIQYE